MTNVYEMEPDYKFDSVLLRNMIRTRPSIIEFAYCLEIDMRRDEITSNPRHQFEQEELIEEVKELLDEYKKESRPFFRGEKLLKIAYRIMLMYNLEADKI